MWLNDEATDEERQQLLPYVTRLACADAPEIERTGRLHPGAIAVPFTFQAGLAVLEGALAIGRQPVTRSARMGLCGGSGHVCCRTLCPSSRAGSERLSRLSLPPRCCIAE